MYDADYAIPRHMRGKVVQDRIDAKEAQALAARGGKPFETPTVPHAMQEIVAATNAAVRNAI